MILKNSKIISDFLNHYVRIDQNKEPEIPHLVISYMDKIFNLSSPPI